jgi:hypothetical protein
LPWDVIECFTLDIGTSVPYNDTLCALCAAFFMRRNNADN